MYQGLQCILSAWFDTKKNVNKTFIFIAIGSSKIAPQRMTTPPEARKFKTLAAAYSYLRNFLDYEGDITIHIAP